MRKDRSRPQFMVGSSGGREGEDGEGEGMRVERGGEEREEEGGDIAKSMRRI